jgi:hypothetical protein
MRTAILAVAIAAAAFPALAQVPEPVATPITAAPVVATAPPTKLVPPPPRPALEEKKPKTN